MNSGVVVAKTVELEDRFENMGAQLLREVATRTSEMAGDGTTTATVLAHAMIREGLKYLAAGIRCWESLLPELGFPAKPRTNGKSLGCRRRITCSSLVAPPLSGCVWRVRAQRMGSSIYPPHLCACT